MNPLPTKALRCLPFLFLSLLAGAQTKLKVIRATSTQVAIRDGDEFDQNAWTLSPKTRPDVFLAERTRKTKQVTFFTDIDSIRVKVKPGSSYDFVILLNGKDSCYTRIKSAVPPKDQSHPALALQDTIPFILTSHEAISVRAVINEKDTVMLHFDTGSLDLRLTKEAIIKKTKLLSNQPEYLAGKAAPDFNRLKPVFNLQIGKLVFQHPGFAATDVTARDMDGRFGWNLFEGKQVEIDFDKSLIIVHSGKLISSPKGYRRSALEFKHDFLLVKGALEKEKKIFEGDFLMDTGAESAIILDSTWATQHSFASGLPVMKTITLTNPKGVKFETKVVLAPAFFLAGYQLRDIPALILGTRNPAGFSVNNLGGGLLKRFHIIMDFKNDCIYWKPNALFNSPGEKS